VSDSLPEDALRRELEALQRENARLRKEASAQERTMRQLRRITDRSVGSAERNRRMFARAIASLEAEIGVRREAEQRARHAQDHAEREAIATARFLANISHEVRTPLTGILGTLELLGQDTLPAAQARLVELAHTSARSLGLLLNDILDLSKLQSGRMELEDVPFVLQDIVDDTLSMFGPGAQARGVTLSGLVSPELPWELRGEPSRMRQIIGNLVGNAVKFTHQGEVRVELQAAGDGLLLTVSDTGIGIPEEAQETIFQQFTQADTSTTRRYGGSGLGLSIVWELVKLLRGHIWLESAPDEGSRFHGSLPLQASRQHGPRPLQDRVFQAEGFSARDLEVLRSLLLRAGGILSESTGQLLTSDQLQRPLRYGSLIEQLQGLPDTTDLPGLPDSLPVLLVEDHVINQKVITTLLSRMGVTVTLAGNGVEALRCLDEQHFPVIFMDCQMPLLDGYEATRTIRRELPPSRQPHIIALTASTLKGDRERCEEAGMDDYLTKPVSTHTLHRAIMRALSRRSGVPDG
jgi:signal transduction histidine kinase/CheY-like chemotaxis protein